MSEEKMRTDEAKQIAEILDVVSERAPRVLGTIRDMLYSPEAAKQMGQAVGTFYKELVAAGMSPEEAQNLTREYMSTLKSFSNLNLGPNQDGKQSNA